MSYRLRVGESAPRNARRLCRQRIRLAQEQLAPKYPDRHEGIHEARKRCKEIRAVLRLFRYPLGGRFAGENAHFRDAARRLADIRDAQASLEALVKLKDADEAALGEAQWAALQSRLQWRLEQAAVEQAGLQGRLAEVRAALSEAERRLTDWRWAGEAFSLMAPGLRRSYRDGRRALGAARADASPEALHEWRKRVKDHWYHAQLFRNLWPPVFKAYRDELKALSDLLGDDHDLVVLSEIVTAQPGMFHEIDAPALGAAIAHRQRALRSAAFRLGRRLYAEKPKALVRRWQAYWMVRSAEAGSRRP